MFDRSALNSELMSQPYTYDSAFRIAIGSIVRALTNIRLQISALSKVVVIAQVIRVLVTGRVEVLHRGVWRNHGP